MRLGNERSGRLRGAGYWVYASHLWCVFAIAVSNILLGAAILASPWTARRRPLPAGARPFLIALGLYVLALLASVVASYKPLTSLQSMSEIFTLSGILLGLALVAGEGEVRRIVDGIGVVAAVVACAGITQYLLGYDDLHNRIHGPFSHYMTFSGVLLIGDVLLLAGMLREGAVRSLWRWGAVAVITTALLASYTRSAWVGLASALVVLLVVRAPRLLLALPPVALVFALIAPSPLLDRVRSIADLRDASNYDRLCMARAGVEMVAENPLFGIGPGLVRERYPIYRDPTAPRYWVPHLHNSFLQLAAERGLLGLAAYLALVAASVRAGLRGLRAAGGVRGPQADLYLGALTGLLGFNVAGLFEDNWGDTEVQRLALFLLLVPFLLAARSDAGEEEAGGGDPGGDPAPGP